MHTRWKETKLLTRDLTSQQQMLTAQLSTSMLRCISNSHCVAADLMCQQNTQQQEKSMRLKADTQPQQSAANAMSSTTKLLYISNSRCVAAEFKMSQKENACF